VKGAASRVNSPALGAAAGAAARGDRPDAAAHAAPAPRDGRSWDAIRGDFPILRRLAHGKPLVYLDSAASSQKPRPVIERITSFYENEYSNIHRGVHLLSQLATDAYEGTRERVRSWINARESREIVFVRGTTEAVNLVASSYGRPHVGAGDEVLVSAMEHHSNIVPWQMLCAAAGATLRVIPIDDAGDLVLDDLDQLLSPRTRIVALVHVSNALGTINPVRTIIDAAHRRSVPVLLDGAQAAPHLALDMQALDCDFYAFSSHKMYGPSGVGVLYGKAELLDAMPPYQGGGDMIRTVSFEGTTYNTLPYKFEAGTQNIADVVGLGAAIDYIDTIGHAAIAAHEAEMLRRATAAVGAIPRVRLIGAAREKASILSFVVEGIHPHDVGTVLDREGVAVRAGHHCTQPLMQRYGVPATARASFGVYNNAADVDALVRGVQRVIEVLG
jgi:cysteine desulfurase/selenocysteine lyase